MNAIQGERTIIEADGKRLTLTTHRVRYSGTTDGRVQSLLLRDVTFCELSMVGRNVLLILAALAALVSRQDAEIGWMVFVGVAFVAAYFATRRPVLVIASAGGRLVIPAKGMAAKEAIGIIDAVEAAKLGAATTPDTVQAA